MLQQIGHQLSQNPRALLEMTKILRPQLQPRNQGSQARTIVATNKMSTKLLTIAFLQILLASILSGCRVEASGVFELELLKFEQIDPALTANMNGSKIEQTAPSNSQPHQTNVARVLVCLKEAFTSQLEGPCTFGNASLTLNLDSTTQLGVPPADLQQDGRPSAQAQNKQHSQQGSLVTNTVRILFTFRWTKSFTIIITAEQMRGELNSDQPSRRISQTATHRLGAANGSNNTDLATAGKALSTNHSLPAAASEPFNRLQFIDRHVLTENEVLPNLEPNPTKPWASRFSRSLKSSIAYRFRVYCSLNYYGDGCTTFCRARDDQFGHYNCSTSGQKVCLDGWHGADCDKATCRQACNAQHGYCERPDTCQCRPGWTGPRCDECITYPGCENGYCLSPWQCICQRNWGGVLCDRDLNYCGTHEPCKNNGTCQNIAPGRYKCNCEDGFTGVDCDINLSALPGSGSLTQMSAGCALNPCLNGGTCYGFNSHLTDFGFGGVDSATNRGSRERFYRCQCAPGWTGDYCQWSDPNSLSLTSVFLATSSSLEVNVTNPTQDPTSTAEDLITESAKSDILDRISPLLTTLIESQPPISSNLDMKHLISGVVIASVIGVFLASLLLAWCCLALLERNRFSLIQMSIVRGGLSPCQPTVSLTLRRMHDKIRDSFRRSPRGRIKPETKLSIDNVLRPAKPPPSYEESSNLRVHKVEQQSTDGLYEITIPEVTNHGPAITDESLVIKGALKQKLASSNISANDNKGMGGTCSRSLYVTNAQLSCPMHGHLYRQEILADNPTTGVGDPGTGVRPTSPRRQPICMPNYSGMDPYHIHLESQAT